jgi:hypothetical protein
VQENRSPLGRRPPYSITFVGAAEQRRGHLNAERLRGLEVNRQRVLCWRLNRQVGRLFAFEDAIDIPRSAPVQISQIGAVR